MQTHVVGEQPPSGARELLRRYRVQHGNAPHLSGQPTAAGYQPTAVH